VWSYCLPPRRSSGAYLSGTPDVASPTIAPDATLAGDPNGGTRADLQLSYAPRCSRNPVQGDGEAEDDAVRTSDLCRMKARHCLGVRLPVCKNTRKTAHYL
jgi:hypothetical protein